MDSSVYSYSSELHEFYVDTSNNLPTELVSYEDAIVTTTLFLLNYRDNMVYFLRSIDFNIINCITSDVSLAVSKTGETEFVGELDVLKIFGLD